MQPKNDIKRIGLHTLLGDEKLLLIKVFRGKVHGYVRVMDEGDRKKIIDAVLTAITLDEALEMSSSEVYDKLIQVELSTPLSIDEMNTTRNLSTGSGHVSTLIECDELARALFTNPKSTKAGSYKDKRWEAKADLIIRKVIGKSITSDSLRGHKLVDEGLLVPVSGIKQRGDATELIIYRSELKIRITPSMELKHGGGVVIYRVSFYQGKYTVKRMQRIATPDGGKRDTAVAPHSQKRVHRPVTDEDVAELKCRRYKDMLIAFEEDEKVEELKASILPEIFAGMSMLGCVDSSVSKFNSIIGENIHD
jgi:hypothetical protein